MYLTAIYFLGYGLPHSSNYVITSLDAATYNFSFPSPVSVDRCAAPSVAFPSCSSQESSGKSLQAFLGLSRSFSDSLAKNQGAFDG